MSDWMKRTSMPNSAFNPRAISIAFPEKSTPVALAPSRAHDIVSMPKWHCRCSNDLPDTSPSASSSIELREMRPALKPATS